MILRSGEGLTFNKNNSVIFFLYKNKQTNKQKNKTKYNKMKFSRVYNFGEYTKNLLSQIVIVANRPHPRLY